MKGNLPTNIGETNMHPTDPKTPVVQAPHIAATQVAGTPATTPTTHPAVVIPAGEVHAPYVPGTQVADTHVHTPAATPVATTPAAAPTTTAPAATTTPATTTTPKPAVPHTAPVLPHLQIGRAHV